MKIYQQDEAGNPAKCPGQRYVLKVQGILNSRGHYVLNNRYVPIPEESCQDLGCPSCTWIKKILKASVQQEVPIGATMGVPEGRYVLKVTNVQRDNDNRALTANLIFDIVAKQ